MTVQERIESDFIREMKAGNRPVVSALRMLKAALKNAQIEKMAPLDDSGAIETISREAKKMRDALETYRSAGRQDMVDRAEAEISVFQAYLPQPLGREALEGIVRSKISELGAVGPKDMGRVMAAVMKEAQGQADGSVVSEMVRSALLVGSGG
ncbi:GatB/YqeY domain-containing protein [Candidatus Uhrbacteria bacterium]|nr:GatB/YqeY domain-containing protein [Candidatus Uhrbacteria bacterium]